MSATPAFRLGPGERLVPFVGGAVVIYVLMILAWPLLGAPYAAAFRGCGNLLYGSFGADGRVRLVTAPPTERGADTIAVMTNRRAGVQARLPISVRYLGYVPTVLLLALVLSTPVAWKRRGWAVLWGLLIVSAVIALRLLLVLLEEFSRDNVFALYHPGPIGRTVLQVAAAALTRSILSSYVIAVVVWIPVIFRRGDWDRLTQPSERGSQKTTTHTPS